MTVENDIDPVADGYALGAWAAITDGTEGYHNADYRSRLTRRQLAVFLDQYRAGRRDEHARECST